MLIRIKANENINELIDVLQEQEIKVNPIDDTSIEVDVTRGDDYENDEYERLLHILSLFIAQYAFEDMLTEFLLKLSINKKKTKEMVKAQIEEQRGSNYFNYITKILLREYFKNLSVLKIDSFRRFNMKGLKEEMEIFASNIVDLQENGEGEISEEFELGAQDVFDSIRDTAVLNGLNMTDFYELQARMENGRVFYFNSKEVRLDQEFFAKILGGDIQFYVEDKVDDPNLIEDMLTLSVLVKIFEIKRIVMHKSMTTKAKESLRQNIRLLTEHTDRIIKVDECQGCENC